MEERIRIQLDTTEVCAHFGIKIRKRVSNRSLFSILHIFVDSCDYTKGWPIAEGLKYQATG